MNLIEIFIILLVHWMADFVFQTDEQAKNKSNNINALISHTASYSYIWFVTGIIYITFRSNLFTNMEWYNSFSLFKFISITFITHTIIDYFTSKLNSKLWKNNKTHQFFVSIGFDQVLHYVQLFTSYYYLTK